MLSSKFTQPDIEEQAKLDKIARTICPNCWATLILDKDEVKCEACKAFKIPFDTYVAIKRQYGDKSKEDN